MTFDTNYVSLLVTTSALLISGYVSLIRRIDNNEKNREVKDAQHQGILNDIQTQLRSMAQLMQIQIDSIQNEIKEFKEWKKEKE